MNTPPFHPSPKEIQPSELERAVLLHLKHGAAKWGAVFSHFYQAEGGQRIEEVLGRLADWGHIMVESDGTATITESGREQLHGSP